MQAELKEARKKVVDDQFTSPEIIYQQYQFGFAALADLELDPVSVGGSASSGGGTGGGTSTGGGGWGGGGGGFDPPGCFSGETLITLANGSEITFEELYRNKNRKGSQYAKSFDKNNNAVAGRIDDVFMHIAYKYLLASFDDGTQSKVKGEHRYYTSSGDHIPIKKLLNKSVFNKRNEPVKVTHLELREDADGIAFYNARIQIYENYCADGKRVHNLKIPPV